MEICLPIRVKECFEKENIRLFYADTVDSTNKRAREYASRLSGELSSPVLLVAEGQSEGRGRLGRSFFSPASTGLYMTLLVPMPERSESFARLTALCAVCVVEAIKEIFNIEARIKWVNDLYFEGKKVAGILAESFPVGERRYIAVGVGINLATKDFPDELSDKAGSLLSGSDADELLPRKIALAFLLSKQLLEALECEDSSAYMKKYRESSCVIGRRIRFSIGDGEKEGVAVDIDRDGALVVELERGERIRLSTGEISIFSFDGKWS